MATAISELIAQKNALERKIREAQEASKADAIAEIRRMMAAYGLTPADLSSQAKNKGGLKPGSKVPAKYKDAVTGSTWTGRGLKPKWLVTALEAGRSIEDFRI